MKKPVCCYFWLSLLASLLSQPAQALVMTDTSLGMALSGNLKAGQNFAVDMQIYALSVDYIGELGKGLLKVGKERFSLGLAMQTGSVTYRTADVVNQGMHLAFGLRLGWSTWLGDKWIVEVTSSFILYSRLSAASFAQTYVDGKIAQSASLSDYSGRGNLGLGIKGSRRLGIKIAKYELYAGSSLTFTQQSLGQKVDSVISTIPSTGQTTSLSKSSKGNFQLTTIAGHLHLGIIF